MTIRWTKKRDEMVKSKELELYKFLVANGMYDKMAKITANRMSRMSVELIAYKNKRK
jgi:hypothetical protein